jgi:cell division protein FtsQ
MKRLVTEDPLKKTKASLKHQSVKRKKERDFSFIWKMITFAGSSFIKFSFLLIGLLIISLLFLSAYQYLLTSPYIKLERIIVTGVDEKTKQEILKISKLNLNLSLLAINLNELKHRIEKCPWIRSVELAKRFPHTLIIQAQKEIPYAIVLLEKLYYMDQFGRIFKEIDPSDGIDYPIITGVSQEVDSKEDRLKLAAQWLRVLEMEKEPWSLKDLSEMHMMEAGNVDLYFRSLPAVIKLKGSDLTDRIVALKKVVKHLDTTGRLLLVKSINLHYRDGAVVSFRGDMIQKAPQV